MWTQQRFLWIALLLGVFVAVWAVIPRGPDPQVLLVIELEQQLALIDSDSAEDSDSVEAWDAFQEVMDGLSSSQLAELHRLKSQAYTQELRHFFDDLTPDEQLEQLDAVLDAEQEGALKVKARRKAMLAKSTSRRSKSKADRESAGPELVDSDSEHRQIPQIQVYMTVEEQALRSRYTKAVMERRFTRSKLVSQ